LFDQACILIRSNAFLETQYSGFNSASEEALETNQSLLHFEQSLQNQLALELYDRLLQNLLKGEEYVKILMQKGEILQIIGRWHESEICFHEALFDTTSLGNVSLKARAHISLGTLLMLKGEYEQAATHLGKGVNSHVQNADNQGVSEGYGRLGTLHFRQGEYNAAAEYFEKSISINRGLGLPSNTQIVANWGLTYMNQGNYTEGVRVQEEELNRCQIEGDIVGMANLRVNLGIVLTEKGDDDTARHHLEAGLDLAQQLGNKQLISIALGCIGNIWLNKNEFEKAHTFLEQDRQMVEELGDRQGIAIVSELIGKYYFLQKQFDTAELWFQKSLTFSQQLHYQKGVAKALHGLGKVANALKKHDQARRLLDEAIQLARTIKNQYLLGFCLVDKGFSLLAQGQIKAAAAIQAETEKVSAFLKNEKLRRYILHFCSALKVEIGN
ncbi:MAG: tetratricopeptide repeat protein, partial [Saprospiraceae bacterium]|nr:tetratricopeptide repeat protein [Saprospiraceae bacterium]